MDKKTIIVLSLLCCVSNWGYSQGTTHTNKTYYIGTEIGTSLGNSTFKSFGINQTNIGVKVGVLGGLYLNRFLSSELNLNYSHMKLSAYDCCQNLWLCEGNRYFAAVAGKQSYAYADLYSAIDLYEVGSKLNIDFAKIKHPNARLMATLSPSLSLIASNAKIKTSSNNQTIDQSGSLMHLGIGAEAGVGYRFNKHLTFKLYSGVTYVTNKNFDGMPDADHKTNLLWNKGLKLIFTLNKKECKKVIPQAIENIPVAPKQADEVKVVVNDSVLEVKKDTLPVIAQKPMIDIPEKTIYFKLNKHNITDKEQLDILNEIVKVIKENPQSTISIDGWADKSGTKKWNELISIRRAQFIKEILIKNGIEQSRILYTKGNGVDYQNIDNLKNTRRTVIKIVATEKTK